MNKLGLEDFKVPVPEKVSMPHLFLIFGNPIGTHSGRVQRMR